MAIHFHIWLCGFRWTDSNIGWMTSQHIPCFDYNMVMNSYSDIFPSFPNLFCPLKFVAGESPPTNCIVVGITRCIHINIWIWPAETRRWIFLTMTTISSLFSRYGGFHGHGGPPKIDVFFFWGNIFHLKWGWRLGVAPWLWTPPYGTLRPPGRRAATLRHKRGL